MFIGPSRHKVSRVLEEVLWHIFKLRNNLLTWHILPQSCPLADTRGTGELHSFNLASAACPEVQLVSQSNEIYQVLLPYEKARKILFDLIYSVGLFPYPKIGGQDLLPLERMHQAIILQLLSLGNMTMLPQITWMACKKAELQKRRHLASATIRAPSNPILE